MKINVDGTKCQAYGVCVEEAPDLFDLDDFGYAQATNGGDVPAGSEGAAEAAIKACPASAIRKL